MCLPNLSATLYKSDNSQHQSNFRDAIDADPVMDGAAEIEATYTTVWCTWSKYVTLFHEDARLR